MIAEPTRTDGHRTIGRPWHASPLKSFALAEAICLSIRNTLPLPHPKKIRSLLFLTIQYWCLYLILVGRSRPWCGQQCSSVSNRENRSVTSRMITAYPMRRSAGCCVPLVAAKWDV
jgi:hypothetical protein